MVDRQGGRGARVREADGIGKGDGRRRLQRRLQIPFPDTEHPAPRDPFLRKDADALVGEFLRDLQLAEAGLYPDREGAGAIVHHPCRKRGEGIHDLARLHRHALAADQHAKEGVGAPRHVHQGKEVAGIGMHGSGLPEPSQIGDDQKAVGMKFEAIQEPSPSPGIAGDPDEAEARPVLACCSDELRIPVISERS